MFKFIEVLKRFVARKMFAKVARPVMTSMIDSCSNNMTYEQLRELQREYVRKAMANPSIPRMSLDGVSDDDDPVETENVPFITRQMKACDNKVSLSLSNEIADRS